MTKPITPEEISVAHAKEANPKVIECFNKLIAKNWDGQRSVFKLNDAVASVCSALEITRDQAYVQKLFDVEEVFRAAGWKVEYDNPAYCESYPATYTFTKKRSR